LSTAHETGPTLYIVSDLETNGRRQSGLTGVGVAAPGMEGRGPRLFARETAAACRTTEALVLETVDRGTWPKVCLLRGDGTALSSVSSSSRAAPTAAIAKIAEARISHMHNCTTPAGIPPGMSSSPAPRFAPSEPSRPVSSPRNKHTQPDVDLSTLLVVDDPTRKLDCQGIAQAVHRTWEGGKRTGYYPPYGLVQLRFLRADNGRLIDSFECVSVYVDNSPARFHRRGDELWLVQRGRAMKIDLTRAVSQAATGGTR